MTPDVTAQHPAQLIGSHRPEHIEPLDHQLTNIYTTPIIFRAQERQNDHITKPLLELAKEWFNITAMISGRLSHFS